MGKQSSGNPSRKPEDPLEPSDSEKVPENASMSVLSSSSDHRVLGRRLGLFSIDEEIGGGLVLWHPKGDTTRRIIRGFWEEEHLRNGYQLVSTPHIARGELWTKSGHMDYYSENMYVFEKDGEPFVVKPMNCPFHVQIYRSEPRSYRELPIRYAEWGTVYRYERSGTLHGLMRARGFTQDDAHIFCTKEQLEEEVSRALRLAQRILGRLGFTEYKLDLSTRDPERADRYMGSGDEWESAQGALRGVLEKEGLRYTEMRGEAAFYGPKIDVKIVDSSGREWQCSTIQFDFNLPKRFDLTYIGEDGRGHPPLMIHRVLLGSVERFFGILVEHYQGNFPAWLAPTQVIVLYVSEKYKPRASEVHEELTALGIRSELDERASTVGYKIREAETRKIPFMVVYGGREAETGRLSVRRHGVGEIGSMTLEELVTRIEMEGAAEPGP